MVELMRNKKHERTVETNMESGIDKFPKAVIKHSLL
jgi:hypothetical protein